jgi:hypothetical protein
MPHEVILIASTESMTDGSRDYGLWTTDGNLVCRYSPALDPPYQEFVAADILEEICTGRPQIDA